MNRWQAISEIIKAFIDKGHAGFAFGTVLVFASVLIFTAIAGAIGVGKVSETVRVAVSSHPPPKLTLP
ncbi:hypothetical protein EWE75_01315 [Sphingomonas populi]|uniref:Uncharacterized protein n=1 Tax=Sphingomonas populi TaxID=2484750 RepID=A0A4Q6Y0Z9_9SPHN|nr:hypothetical protein [Sphingomonas populi]RZF66520.1 hypothetical protein EWE75_01315 [Sphingomonas populi]